MKIRATCVKEQLGELKIVITSDVPEIIATTYKDGRPLEVDIEGMKVIHDKASDQIIIEKLVITSLYRDKPKGG